MTTPTIPVDQITTIAQRGQEAVTTAVRTWTETLQRYATNASPEAPLPSTEDAHAIVGAYFDLTAQLVADQRELTALLVDSGAQTAEAFVSQLKAVAAN